MTINLLDVLAFLRRHALRLSAWAVAFAVLGLLVAFVVPKTFRASATILPPEEDDTAISLQQVRRGLGGLGGIGRLGNYFTQEDIAMAVLRSRSVHETIAREFHLQDRYHARNLQDAVIVLQHRTTVRVGNEGTITISVEDSKADLAADMANAFLAQLDHFNQDVRSFRARRSRQFLERRLAQEDSLLAGSEKLFADYQKKHGTVVIAPEDRSGMQAAGSVMSSKVQAEIQLELAREYASPSSEEVQRLSSEVRELSRQAGELPATQLGGAGLVRNVAIKTQLVAMLALELEDARIREAIDTPTIQALDRAIPPTRPIWPRKSVLTLLGGLVGLGLGLWDIRGFRRNAARAMP